MKKTTLMLIRMITMSKGQYIAVVAIIITGLTVYTSMNMAAVNLGTTLKTYYEQNNFADVFVEAMKVPRQEVHDLGAIEGVKEVQGRIVYDAPFVTENEDERVTTRIITVPPTNDGINRLTIISGSYLGDSDREALVLQQFADARRIRPGDTIRVQMNGTVYSLKVAGIAASPEFIYLMSGEQAIMPDPESFGAVFVSEKLAQEAFGLSGSYNDIVIVAESGANIEKLTDTLEDELEPFGLERVVKREYQLSNSVIDEEIAQLQRMAGSLPVVFILVAAIMLAMMISRMVKRDRMKVGAMKGLGYSNREVIAHYAFYSLSAGILGGLAGSVLGMLLAGAMTQLYLEFFNIPLLKVEFFIEYVLLAILLSSAFCSAAGILGARGILNISPAESMQNEAPRKGKRIFLERIGFFWRHSSFSWKMVYKNIFRNKKRTAFVISGVVVTYGMLLFTFTMPDVVNEFTTDYYKEFQKMDYNISFIAPMNRDVINDLNATVDIDHAEGRIEYPFEIRHGAKSKAVSVVGLPRDTVFYDFKDPQGRPVRIPEEGMLITENLAGLLDLAVGDEVRVKTFIPNRDDTSIRVSGIIRQTLGMSAYMDLDYMDGLLLEENAINGVYLDSQDPDIISKLLTASNISSIMSPKDVEASFDEYMDTTNYSIWIMVIFSGILGAAVVYNSTIISLGEREMEFSSLRILGFSKWEIFMILLRENNILTVLGILIGIPVGIGLTVYSSKVFSTEMYTFSMMPSLTAGVNAALATLFFVVLAQVATYRKISSLDFIQALKSRVS